MWSREHADLSCDPHISVSDCFKCVITATRPLLLSALKERLDRLNGGQAHEENFEAFLSLTTTLISTGIKSAQKTVQILAHEESLLGK